MTSTFALDLHSAMTLTRGPDAEAAEDALRALDLVADDETVVRFGRGGSESIVVLVERQGTTFVRKVSSRALSTVAWPHRSGGVMADPFHRAIHQVRLLRGLPPHVARLFPAVHAFRILGDRPGRDAHTGETAVLDLELVPGRTVSQHVADGTLSGDLLVRVYRSVAGLLGGTVHPCLVEPRSTATVPAMHLDKMADRLALACSTPWPGQESVLADRIVLDGRSLLGLRRGLALVADDPRLLAALEPPRLSRVVGDTNTQNIMLVRPPRSTDTDADLARSIRFLDPRGIGIPPSHVDDPVYDWKFWHNTVGHYDQIFARDMVVHGGPAGWHVDYDTGTPMARAAQSVAGHVRAVNEDYVRHASAAGLAVGEHAHLRFLFLMASHFAAMLPFHTPDPDVDVPDWRPFAMYCEAVTWLDRCLRHWNGASLDDVLPRPSLPSAPEETS